MSLFCLINVVKEDGWVEDSAISFECDVKMWAGGTTSRANVGDGLTGKDFRADGNVRFGNEVAITYRE